MSRTRTCPLGVQRDGEIDGVPYSRGVVDGPGGEQPRQVRRSLTPAYERRHGHVGTSAGHVAEPPATGSATTSRQWKRSGGAGTAKAVSRAASAKVSRNGR